jgi:predicted phage terminase large subunit-like protein
MSSTYARHNLGGESERLVRLAAEFDRVDRASRGLLDFLLFLNPQFERAAHLEVLCARLDRLVDTPNDRLIITLPPRHGKSETISRNLPAYFVGRHPRSEVILSSGSELLARGFGRDVRGAISGGEYRRVFPDVRLSSESAAADEFETTTHSKLVFRPAGGQIVGYGADLLVVDDAFTNRQQADSRRERETILNYFRSVLRTRLLPGGRIVVMGTRWHESDLIGTLLKASGDGTGEHYDLIHMPAISTDASGERRALWPGRYPLESLDATRAAIGEREWQAQYQGAPTPPGGGFLNTELFGEWTTLPNIAWFASIDLAFTSTERSDYTAAVVGGVDAQGNLVIAHAEQVRVELPEVARLIARLTRRFGIRTWHFEGDTASKLALQHIKSALRSAPLSLRPEPYFQVHSPAGSKEDKARSLQALLDQGLVLLPSDTRACGWEVDALVDQASRFPHGSNDDLVDAMGLLGRVYSFTKPAKAAPTQETVHLPDGTDIPRPKGNAATFEHDGRTYTRLSLNDLFEDHSANYRSNPKRI